MLCSSSYLISLRGQARGRKHNDCYMLGVSAELTSFHFILNSLNRVKASIDKITALQLSLSTKQREYLKKPIYNFMSQLTYKKVKENIESILRDSFLKSRKTNRSSFGFGS